jgi:7-carboxy-7-deazaguanine synthase
LRCSYCDTAYAFTQGTKQTLTDVCAEVRRLAGAFHNHAEPETPFTGRPEVCPTLGRLPLVELTGGEPLLQKNSLPLMRALCDNGFTVLLETSGAHDIAPVDPRVRRIMDLKCPGSGEAGRNRWENLPHLKNMDEIKFVITSREDYEWAKARIVEHGLAAMCPLLFSWAEPLAPEQQDESLKAVPPGHTPISRKELAERIIADALPVRFQVQLHKVIWSPETRGV